MTWSAHLRFPLDAERSKRATVFGEEEVARGPDRIGVNECRVARWERNAVRSVADGDEEWELLNIMRPPSPDFVCVENKGSCGHGFGRC